MHSRHSATQNVGIFCVLLLGAALPGVGFVPSQVRAQSVPIVDDIELQPLAAQVERVAKALDQVGSPLSPDQRAQLDAALSQEKPPSAVRAIQELLDPLCLVAVHINPESRVKIVDGPAPKELMQHGWRAFLIKVHNEAGVTSELRFTSPNARPMHDRSRGDARPPQTISPQDVMNRWCDVHMYAERPLRSRLGGLPLEYRIVEIYSRDKGRREAELMLDAGEGSADLGGRNTVDILFQCLPSVEVQLEVVDDDGSPTTGSFEFRDDRGRVYPATARRLAPDFFFHEQIYRRDGETVRLPPGEYQATYTRGPEYRVQQRRVTVPPAERHVEHFRLERWINMADEGWYSGDHHVHAAGCSHYASPTQGVTPVDMMRHILGEDLNVGCVLTWGPCWYHQKQFFDGQTHVLSTPNYVMRYDVEVSGFPSSPAGHLVLLRLKEDDYPGTTEIEEWPSWDLPILQWAKEQGGVVGFAHSGWGLSVPATSLPTYDMPPFDGIGANEYIVDVTHDACDFISTVDTPAVWELNIWYHTLNCGFTTRISGETDFPCIYDQRVGLGRSYVKLADDQPLNFDDWVQGIKAGRSYASDGLTHLVDFEVDGLGVGEPGHVGQASLLAVEQGAALEIHARAAALLDEKPRDELRDRPLHEQPYWHVERARVGDNRQVAVELIVNGHAVARQLITGDGQIQDVAFDYPLEQSSWIALRVFPAAHTNPVFVEVDGQPIRASKRSAQWCLDAVDRCWQSKSPILRPEDYDAAEAAYEHARRVYRDILAESTDDLNGDG